MDGIHLLIYGVASLISLYFICQIWPKRITSGPPEPAGRWPIIGHLHLFSRTTPFHRTLSELSDRYGPVFLLHLGQHRALVVSSIELAKECFTTNDRAFANRPASLSTKYLSYDYAMFGLSPYGSYWREVRKICTLELLSNRRLELLKHIQLEEVESLIKSLYRDCGKGEPVQMKTRLAFMTMKMMLRMVAGKQYLTNEDDDIGEDKEARETNKFLEELAYMLGVYTAADAIPWLEWLDVGGHLKAMKRVHKTMDKIATSWVAEHRRRRESGNIGDTHDFMDVLISQLDDAHLSDVLQPDTIVKATTMILIVAGTSTTLETLLWALSLLLNHRLELKMVKEELDFHVGRERQVDQSDISKLSYLQAVVKETLRLYPVGPVLVPHESIQPVNVAGYHVPAGTSLYVNVWKMHRDPRVWPDPEDFKPGRFLTSHKEVNVNDQNFELIPFGSGRRSCPGSSLALQVAHLTLARLLHGFECCTPMDGPVDMTEEIGFALTKAMPLHVLLHPRLPQHLYQ